MTGERPVQRVCVFAQLMPDTGLGDLIMRNGLFALVRRRYPAARCTLVIGRDDAAAFGDFLGNHALVDDVLPCPPSAAGPPADGTQFLPCPQYDDPPAEFTGDWGGFLGVLREREFQVCVVDAASVWLHGRAAIQAGIGVRVGVLRGHPQERFLTAAAPVLPRRGDIPDLADYVHGYAAALGVPAPPTAVLPPLPFHPLGPQLGVPAPRVALHVGGRAAWNRRWPLPNYLRLCQLLLAAGCSVVLVGADEQAEHEWLLSALGPAAAGRVTQFGPGPLARTATALAGCQVFAGSDSGPMHLAAALGLPTVALYGPDDSHLFWRDVYPGHRPITHDWPCRELPHPFATTEHAQCEHRCRYRYDPVRPQYPRCVADITVTEVLDAVVAALGQAAPHRDQG